MERGGGGDVAPYANGFAEESDFSDSDDRQVPTVVPLEEEEPPAAGASPSSWWLGRVGGWMAASAGAVATAVFGGGSSEPFGDAPAAPAPPLAGPRAAERQRRRVGPYVSGRRRVPQIAQVPAKQRVENPTEITLVPSMRSYLRDPNPVSYCVVNTALTRRAANEPVTGEELRQTNGDRTLLQLIMRWGNVDFDDPAAQAQLQQYINDCIVPSDEFGGRLRPDAYEHLRTLLQAPCARISKKQRALLRKSGFEFVLLLRDFPHVEADLPGPRILSGEYWSLKSQRLEPLILVLGILIIYFDLGVMCYISVHWYGTNVTYGNITLLSFLGAHVVSFFAVVAMLQTKADGVVYGDKMSDFPTVYLKALPVIPLFETFCCVSALKNTILGDDRNYVVQHDLQAMFTLCRIVHSFAHSVVQLLLQSYFYVWSGANDGNFIGYKCLIASTVVSTATAVPLYVRHVATFHSVNTLGFAYFSDKMVANKEKPASTFVRVLAFLLLYMFECNAFFLIVAVMNVSSCSTNMIVWISIASAIVASTAFMFVWTLCTSKNMLRAARWCWPPIFCQMAFTIFVTAESTSESATDVDCKLFFIIGGVNVVVGYVGWGLLLAVLAAWGIQTLWKTYVKTHVANEPAAV